MRRLRKSVAAGLSILGIILVFAAILLPSLSLSLQLQIAVALVGILALEAGVWNLPSRILPDERRNEALRAEVDTFVGLVRVLNRQALEAEEGTDTGPGPAFRETLAALHSSVDRMGAAAGRSTRRS